MDDPGSHPHRMKPGDAGQRKPLSMGSTDRTWATAKSTPTVMAVMASSSVRLKAVCTSGHTRGQSSVPSGSFIAGGNLRFLKHEEMPIPGIDATPLPAGD